MAYFVPRVVDGSAHICLRAFALAICLPGNLFFHLLTWFFPSFPLGFFSNVTFSERLSLAILYKIAVPWPQGQDPLPISLLHCFHYHLS